MTALTIRKIESLTETELAEIVGVCLRAYKDEVAVVSMVGGRDELRPLLFTAMIRAGALDGELYVGEVNERIVSLALWFKPGHRMFSREEQRSLGFNQLIEKLSADDRHWWTNTYSDNMNDFLKKTLPVPSKMVWFLTVLGTDPAYQRKGYATILMEYVHNEIVSPAYCALCTTTETNVRFYNALGYPTLGSFTMPSHLEPFPIYALLREV